MVAGPQGQIPQLRIMFLPMVKERTELGMDGLPTPARIFQKLTALVKLQEALTFLSTAEHGQESGIVSPAEVPTQRGVTMFLQTDQEILDNWWADRVANSNLGIEPVWWSQKVGYIGEIVTDALDIDQCLRIIMLTRKGQDIHRPSFASNLPDYLDHPIQSAKPHVIRETFLAIKAWEPRVLLDRVVVSYPEISQLKIQAQWRLQNNLQFSSVTEI